MKLLTVNEVAQRLKLSRSKVYDLCASGALPHLKIGGAKRISEQDLADFLSSCRVVHERPQRVQRIKSRHF